MERNLFQVSSVVEKISTRSDNTISIHFGTQELPAEQATSLFGLRGKQGWLLFSENEMSEEDIPADPAPEFKTDKTPSQRLRACLFKYWELNTGKTKTFDNFYREWIELKINAIKETLPN